MKEKENRKEGGREKERERGGEEGRESYNIIFFHAKCIIFKSIITFINSTLIINVEMSNVACFFFLKSRKLIMKQNNF